MNRPSMIAIVLTAALVTTLIAASAGGAGDRHTGDRGHADLVRPDSRAAVAAPTEEIGLLAANVSVNMPCDTEWKQAYHTAWYSRANDAIEAADNALYAEFDINLYVAASPTCWDSDNSENDIRKLLDDAAADCGKGGQDMMIAFTGQVSHCGAARLNDAYCIVAKSWAEPQICQHEVSHCYGASHSTCDGGECVIADCVSHYGKWCGTCHTTIRDNRNKY